MNNSRIGDQIKKTGILFLVFVLVFPSVAQKTKDQIAVATELAQKINSASFSKNPVRLAIVTFVPVQGNASAINTYGEYLTESIIGKLSEHSDKIKLFERKRLDAILKENELMLSGMMKPSEALKIGELLPIDALFSGTYTKLKSYIDVSGRLIDVVSGEILMSYTGRIKLTKNIKTLFPEDGPTVADPQKSTEAEAKPEKLSVKVDPIQECKEKTDVFAAKLHDLSTDEKVNSVVTEAMRTPFENTCGKLHYHLINALGRYNLRPPVYKKFLLATLDTIAYPPGDDRAYSILSYLTKDGIADEEEWSTGLNAIRKIGDYTLSTYLGFLFNKINDPDLAELQKRCDRYFELLNQSKIGLPRPIEYNKGFFEMMSALSANQEIRLYVYEHYSEKVLTEPETSVSSHFMFLKKMYDEEKNAATKTKVIGWIANYFNKHSYKKSPE
jgi:TolB-like protein